MPSIEFGNFELYEITGQTHTPVYGNLFWSPRSGYAVSVIKNDTTSVETVDISVLSPDHLGRLVLNVGVTQELLGSVSHKVCLTADTLQSVLSLIAKRTPHPFRSRGLTTDKQMMTSINSRGLPGYKIVRRRIQMRPQQPQPVG